MKQFIKSSLLLLGSVCLLAACNDDNDSNPTLKEPSTFVLNTPAYAGTEIDLASSTAIPFSWSQPDYGFPAAVNYQLEVSLSGNFTVSLAEAEADESGSTVADYATLDEVYASVTGSMDVPALAKALQQIAKWPENNVPTAQTLNVRATAATPGAPVAISNVVQIKVNPYYVELKDAAPVIWYLIGGCIADGKWSNGEANIGTSMIPMYTIAGEEYDKKTGFGNISYTGFFLADTGFKIIEKPGSWDYGMCGGTQDGGWSYRNADDDPGDIKITESGYYTIVLNTGTHEMSMTKYEGTVKNFGVICMAGDFNGWSTDANEMTPITTVADCENHDWVMSYEGAGSAKFLSDRDWGTNWGANTFPFGTGVQNGDNIPVTEGKYKVFFNDITGAYSFISAE